jgi:NADH-ubiquinone oxidoreductase MWFE subunit
MFAITGGGLAKLDHMKNGGKRGRWGIDSWDRVRMKAITSKMQ